MANNERYTLENNEPIDAEMATSDVDLDVEEDSGDDSIYFHTEGIEEGDDEEDDEVRGATEEDEEEDEEDDEAALRRLSQQAIRRREASMEYEGDEDVDEEDDEDEEEDDDDGEDEDEDGDDDDDDEDDNEDDDEDGNEENADDDANPADFLRRLLRARSRNNGRDLNNSNSDEGRGEEFVDLIQTLMGGGVMFNGGGGLGGGNFGVHSEIDALMNNLNQREDPYLVLESLNELSERLLMMNGITAERIIPANRLAMTLVSIMQDPLLSEELELHLVSCRCLYNFLEVNQDFIHEALNNGAVEALCQKLLEINYIDLTEQALQTLEMISRDPISHVQIVNCDGLKACLQYLDFFTVHAQRKSLIIVANSCIGGINVRNFAKIQDGDVFQLISNVVKNHEDNIVVENGWLAISRIIMSVKLERELLEEGLFGGENEEFINEMVKVILRSSSKEGEDKSSNDGSNRVTFGTSLNLIRSLIVLVSVGIKISTPLLRNRVGKTISECLIQAGRKKKENSKDGEDDTSSQISSLMNTPKELFSQFFTLIGYLLPIPPNSNYTASPAKKEVDELRIKYYEGEGGKDYHQFVDDIWGLLINSFQATMDFEIRRKILINLLRIVSFDVEKIEDVEKICRLLSSVANQCRGEKLESGNVHLLTCLQIAKVLLKKDGVKLMNVFEKEGLLNDIKFILKRYGSKAEDEEEVEDVSMNSQSMIISNVYTDFEFSNNYNGNGDFKSILSICEEIIKFSQEINFTNGNTGGEGMKILEKVVETLRTDRLAQNPTYMDWCKLFQQLQFALGGGEVEEISSFELMSSGVIAEVVQVLRRDNNCYNAFLDTFFRKGGIELLISKLQECLTRSENFEIIGSQGPQGATHGAGSLGFGLANFSKTASMARQLKIKLEDDSEDVKPLPGMQNLILSVHAIATFKSVDAFLDQRLKFLEGIHGKFRDNEEDEEEENVDNEDDGDIQFSINGEIIPNETTVYGAIYKSIVDQGGDNDKIWSTIHPVQFKRVKKGTETDNKVLGIVGITQNEEDEIDPSTLSILQLLKVLFEMNSDKTISNKLFKNWKLTVKLNRQLEDPLVVASGTLPGWSVTLPKQFPMVFPLDSRIFFLQSTSFGYSRLIHNWQLRYNQEEEDRNSGSGNGPHGSNGSNGSSNGSNGGRPPLGRPARHKVRLSRKLLLQSAVKVLGMYGSTPGVLEIEYFDEVGSGLGPTLEFYSTVSKEFCHKKLMLWRDTSGAESEYVVNGNGLFPAPMSKQQLNTDNGKKVLFFFNVLGKFVARGMLDSRIVDFSFNPIFFRVLLMLLQTGNVDSKHVKRFTSIATLRLVDPVLADSLEKLEKMRDDIQELELSFELPGYPQYKLSDKPDEIVTAQNLDKYIQKVIDSTIYSGVIHQVKSFMDGFSKVFPVGSLVIFSAEELVSMFGNGEEDWTRATLLSSINANHGYNKESPTIKNLINILVSLNAVERRLFLQFLTGAPKLPIGGFKALRPELTVVRRLAEDGLKDDDYLPSVMTCANYLKLPNYSSEEVMRTKLIQAIKEGAGAFLLS